MKFPCLTSQSDGLLLAVHLAPRSSVNRVLGLHAGRFKLAVAAPPVDGKANKALIEFLSDLFGIGKSHFEITSGQASKQKNVKITGVSTQSLELRLEELLNDA